MIDSVFTSSTATKNIADRVLREVSRNTTAPIRALSQFIHPVAHAIRMRGKLRRQELPAISDAIIARLQAADNVIDIDTGRYSTGRLSANDSFTVRFVQAVGALTDWMLFMACDVHLSRQRIEIFINSTEFHISSHLLARYMQRGRKSYLEFLDTIMRPLRVSALLSAGRATTENDRIALPIDGGLLLGSVGVISSEDNPFPIRIIFDRNGCTETVDKEHGLPGRIITTWMRTFIDRDALNPKQVALLETLERWEQESRQGIDTWYQSLVFGGTRLKVDYDAERMKDDVARAQRACRGLVNSPEWQNL